MSANMAAVVPVIGKTLGELFGLTDPRVKDVPFPVNAQPGGVTPAVNPHHQFTEAQVRRLLLWIGGAARRNLMVHGPTGSGKSSVIEQVCARLGRECFRVACHGRMEFSELTGQLTVLSDGSTKFVHGPLPRAMESGATLLLDEVNFLHPSMMGALNTVLDGGPLLIPETNELILPHPDFRVAATGNAVDQGDDAALYRGTQRMNLAFRMRFLMMRVDYLGEQDEAVMLNRYYPGLPGVLIEKMVKVASAVRESFKRGDIEAPISSRVLVDWGSIMMKRHSILIAKPEEEIKFALEFVLTDGLRDEDARTIIGVLDRLIAGITLNSAQAAKAPQSQRPKAVSTGASMKVDFLVNPNRDGAGSVTFWMCAIEPGAKKGVSTFGTIVPSVTIKDLTERTAAWIDLKQQEKRNAAGDKRYTVSASCYAGQAEVDDIVSDLVEAISAVKTACNSTGTSQVPLKHEDAVSMFDDIAIQLGLNCRAYLSS